MTDNELIAAYLASKGFDAQGLTGFAAISSQLKYENSGRVHSAFAEAKQASVRRLALAEVRVPNPHHYKAVEPRSVTSKGGSPLIAGVVIRRWGGFTLVDGYHRMKWLNEQGHSSALYIVVS